MEFPSTRPTATNSEEFAVGNIRPAAVWSLYNQPAIEPMDAVNLIDISDHNFYALYGVLVFPLLKLIGSELLVTLEHVQAIHGTTKFNHCLIARYKSHRRFLAMVTNPYYLLINRAREAGVKYLELSFTQAEMPPAGLTLRHHAALLLLRLKSPGDAARLLSSAAENNLEVIYSSHTVANLDIFATWKATNPNPLEYPVTVFLTTANPKHRSLSALVALGEDWNRKLEREPLDYSLSVWQKTHFKEGILSDLLSRLVEN